MPVDTKVADPVWARYYYLREQGHNDYIDLAKKCENFFAGLQWEKTDLAILKTTRRPALTINQILRTVANVMGEQIYNRSEIAFRPRNEGATSEVADALTKVFMQISDNNQLNWLRSDMFCDGLITGRGYLDVRLDFSDSLRGEVRITPLNPRNVMPDADADQMDPDTWDDVIITKWMCADEIELLYSKADADILRGRVQSNYMNPYNIDAYDDRERFGGPTDYTGALYGADSAYNYQRNIRVIERQHRVLAKVDHFVDIEQGDLRMVPSSWSPEQVQEHLAKNPHLSIMKRMVRRVRWTVVADNVVLHDDWSPYKHLTVVPYFPYFRRGKTIGLVENLIGPQELLNKVSSQELHVVNTTANSGWKVKTGTLRNMTVSELEKRGAETGLVVEVDDLDSIDKITPNQIPTGLDRISFKAEEHIKSISGVSDYQTGNAREDVSAKAISQNKQSGSTNLAKVMDNLNRSDHILARNTLDLIQEFYTEPRLVTITKDRLSGSIEQMQVNEVTPEGEILRDLTLGEYAVISTSQPERDTFEDNQFMQSMEMLDRGLPIPPHFIIQSSRLRDKAAIVQEITGNQDSPEAQADKELMQRAKVAEVSSKEGEAQHKHAQAAKTMAEAKEAGQGDAAKLREVELKMQLERQKMDMEMQMEREKMAFEMQMEREKAAFEREMKQLETVETLKTQRAAALHAAAQKPAAGAKNPQGETQQ
jgi:hypothetical protein